MHAHATAVVLLVLAFSSWAHSHDASQGTPSVLVLASSDSAGGQAARPSGVPRISPNGRFVVFSSAEALVPADTNGSVWDTYLKDLATGQTELISVNLSGFSGNQESVYWADVSDDGRYVVFMSKATDLVAIPPANSAMLFLRDRQAGQTRIVSKLSNGQAVFGGPGSITPDGRFVLTGITAAIVPGDTNIWPDAYLYDVLADSMELVSVSSAGAAGNESAGGDAISDDGRFVVFTSFASNMVPGDLNGKADVFRRDRVLGATAIVSRSSAGASGNDSSFSFGVSNDGRWVGFQSYATNLVPGDTNGRMDVFLTDMVAGTTERVSVSSLGMQGDGMSYFGSMTSDGRFIAYATSSTNLVPYDVGLRWDILRFDRLSRTTIRLSVTDGGIEGDGDSQNPSISDGARAVAFDSFATNLVASDSNGRPDVFVRQSPVPVRYCSAKVNSLGCIPAIGSTGIPASSWPSGFRITVRDVLNQVAGSLFYSQGTAASLPFQGGTLCMSGPVRRTPVQSSGGTPSGSDCSGTFAFDFNQWMAGGTDPSLAAGQRIRAQFWSRDGGLPAPWSTSLTDALSFEIWP
jgi:hypothetical protein